MLFWRIRGRQSKYFVLQNRKMTRTQRKLRIYSLGQYILNEQKIKCIFREEKKVRNGMYFP